MKDWIKVGIGVGFGYTVGKFLGRIVTEGIANTFSDIIDETFVKEAKKGDEFAERYCEKRGLEYEECDNSERVMGFHM